MRALPDDGWTVRGDGGGHAPIPANWAVAGVVRHVFTHFVLHLEIAVARLPASASVPGEGAWWPLARLEEAGLPTLFARAAALVR